MTTCTCIITCECACTHLCRLMQIAPHPCTCNTITLNTSHHNEQFIYHKQKHICNTRTQIMDMPICTVLGRVPNKGSSRAPVVLGHTARDNTSCCACNPQHTDVINRRRGPSISCYLLHTMLALQHMLSQSQQMLGKGRCMHDVLGRSFIRACAWRHRRRGSHDSWPPTMT
jgi:hypothetical protein